MSEIGDELERLRIPFDKIKFGKKIEVQGYGSVFEGEFDERRVALKRLNITNLGHVKPKLLAEILTISRFRQHPNLVALLGFCDEKSNEIILVYEYVSSGNLADKMRKHLTTIQRLEICLGAARGLDYLHTGVDSNTPGIIHGDIKLSKILLNSDLNLSKFEAKVSSFGLSKVLPGQVHKIQDTTDPAFEVTGQVKKQSDVYAFGVLLLEVLCGVPELVDTDDYQERHVTELVPKRLEQNRLRKIVHFDIRNEIKTESLETFARIACQCVMKNPEERPTMAQVVEELEKALRLQGGEVSYVQILGIRNGDGAPDGTVIEADNGLTADPYAPEKEVEEKMESVEKNIDDLTSNDNGENNCDENRNVRISSESSNAEKSAGEDVTAIFDTLVSDEVGTMDLMQQWQSHGEDCEPVPNSTHVPDAEYESGNDVIISRNHPETTEETIDDSNGDRNTAEPINGDSNTSDTHSQEVQSSGILDVGDELEQLRIPFEKIKFGNKIDVRGYGSMFEGEFDHWQVALKRLNITNLAHIKPKLLAEILTISRFRQHPNLVALIGFCDEKSSEIILVYEYVSSGNLADKMTEHLTTIQRLEICLGAARGLEYLHSGIVHGDIKLSKILLNSGSTSSKFEAKVSGFGLSKVLPGHVRKTLEPMDPAYEVTGKVTKESDVYSFGGLLLEVLCGVPELVDTDDYQERHVSELVPKRLEQKMLRKIVHFDIRNEIKTEALETYAYIACQCVMKNPEERPTMAKVVEELEKALRLQVGEVSCVQTLGDGVPDRTVAENDDGSGVMMDLNTLEKEPKAKIVSIEENVDDLVVDDKLVSVGENNENKPVAVSSGSSNGEKNAGEDITMEVHDSGILESGSTVGRQETASSEFLNLQEARKKPEMVIEVREGEFDDFTTDDKLEPIGKTQSNRSDTTSSESSNGDDTAPSAYLLHKGPVTGCTTKKPSSGSRNCCSCSWWRFLSDRIALYGGLFWNKLVSFGTWIKGQVSRKHD